MCSTCPQIFISDLLGLPTKDFRSSIVIKWHNGFLNKAILYFSHGQPHLTAEIFGGDGNISFGFFIIASCIGSAQSAV